MAAVTVLAGGTAASVLTCGTHCYAGYFTGGYYLGVDGYIRQSGTTPLTSPQFHADWINVCEQGNCLHWVQTGDYQGFLPNSNSASSVHMYDENMDQCGRYFQNDVGAAPQADYAFYITYDGLGAYNQTCPNGVPSTFYVFEYRKGSWTSVPFFYGQLAAMSGQIRVETELYPNQSVPLGTDYYGCDSNKNCTNSGYGLHIYSGTWALWTSGGSPRNDDPPYLHTYHSYWAYATCNVAC